MSKQPEDPQHGTFLGVHPAWSMGVVLIIAIIVMFRML